MSDIAALVERAKALREQCRIGVEDRGVMPDYVDACVALRHMAPQLLDALIAASCDTQPKAGDVKQAPLVSGAVTNEVRQTPPPSDLSTDKDG